ncbi:predicted protein [Sparassis crispa]|uniref:Uncharacterized protein n=1 Tax=Sparassis crispa TaxID=139825 RepID=A0A401GRL9_9APHY|nr:predicted protein [Sparassis crispa]GBE84865.1 predicted protein [Sparassis crispa]
MCVGENCAPQAVHYINAQLAALYDNALSCVKDHGNAHRSEDRFKYSHALVDFSFGESHGDAKFQAVFRKPELEFICNHDAFFRIKIESGHYHLNHSSEASLEGSPFQEIHDLEAVFRVSFVRKAISGRDAQIGRGQNLIQLVVLDLSKGKLVSLRPPVTNGRDALSFYLEKYVQFLQDAGNHVFFSLPDFDDDRYRLTIDYSLINSTATSLDSIHGISLRDLNDGLVSAWLKAAMIASVDEEDVVDWKSSSLAEFRSTVVFPEDAKTHFHISFGAPKIKLLCSREAIVTFKINEVTFYPGIDFHAAPLLRYTNWEIAVLAEIHHLTEADGSVVSCQIDMDTALVSETLSVFEGFEHADASDEEFSCWSILLEFFKKEYFRILENANYHIVYYHDKRSVKLEEDETITRGTWSDVTETRTTTTVSTEVSSRKEILSNSDMFGFHQVIAVSQASINEHFNNLWLISKTSKTTEEIFSLSSWTYQDTFSATFKPMTFRLLSDGRALVFIHLERGHIKVHEKGSQKHEFGECRLAFEVDLKMCNHAELKGISETWRTKYQNSQAYKHHGRQTDRELRHIYFDFSTADFIHEHSCLKELFGDISGRPIANVKTAIHHIKSFYFSKLTEGGLHLLHTVPVWKEGSTPPAYGLTSAIFHVYSQTAVSCHNWTHTTAGREPIIVILGMTGFAPMKELHLKFSSSWVIRMNSRLTYGTISVARNIFAQERLLDQVARINAATTVIPKFSGVDRDVWDLELTTWEKHPHRKNHKCICVQEKGRDGYSTYKWQHRDIWNYEHEGNQYLTNGSYGVSCLTQNFVEIPTTINNKTLEIKVWGEVTVELSFKSATTNWTVKSASKWDASFALATETGGLKVKETGRIAPVIDKAIIVGDLGSHVVAYQDPHDLLQKTLPSRIDLENTFSELRAFEGIWQYSYPSTYGYTLANPGFNVKGDLIFEARPCGLHVPIASARSVSISASRATSPRAASFTRTLSSSLKTASHTLSETVRVGNGAAVTNGIAVPRIGTVKLDKHFIPRISGGATVEVDESLVPRISGGATVEVEETLVPRISGGATVEVDEPLVPRISGGATVVEGLVNAHNASTARGAARAINDHIATAKDVASSLVEGLVISDQVATVTESHKVVSEEKVERHEELETSKTVVTAVV